MRLAPIMISLLLLAGFICCGNSNGYLAANAPIVVDNPANGNNNGNNGVPRKLDRIIELLEEAECCWPPDCQSIINYDSTEHAAADAVGEVEVLLGQDFVVCENTTELCYVLTNWNATVDFRGQTGIFPQLIEVRPDGTEEVKRGAGFFSRVFIASSGMGLTFGPGSKVVIRLVQTPQTNYETAIPGVGIQFTTTGHMR